MMTPLKVSALLRQAAEQGIPQCTYLYWRDTKSFGLGRPAHRRYECCGFTAIYILCTGINIQDPTTWTAALSEGNVTGMIIDLQERYNLDLTQHMPTESGYAPSSIGPTLISMNDKELLSFGEMADIFEEYGL